jgi:CubicO group peptidase (beta-lactamase class C family)
MRKALYADTIAIPFRTVGFLLPLFAVAASCSAHEEARANKYEQYLSAANARGQFNGAALVFENGKVVYQGAFGIRGIDPVEPLDLNSQFRLASVSKQFTAMAIMTLKERGKLSYDQEIRDFIPELPYRGITIRHLLHHVSGLADYVQLMDETWKTDLRASADGHYSNPAQGEDGVYSTVGDLLKWDRSLYTEKVVSKQTLEEAFTPAVLSNGDATNYGFLRLNMEEYPRSANVYDSYGDALLANGDRSNALANFKKAFELDSTLTATQQEIDELETGAAPRKH